MENSKIGTGNNDEVANGTHATMDKKKWKQPLMVVVPVIIALTAVAIGAISPPAIAKVEVGNVMISTQATASDTRDIQAIVVASATTMPVIPAKVQQSPIGQLLYSGPNFCNWC